MPSALRRPRFGGAESPAASPRSPPSASSQPPSSPTPASSAADRERALQRKAARAVLVGRRDTLAYFDTVRALGQSVYIDVVPSVFNALYVVTVGNVALGNTTCLSAPLAMYTLGALVASYTLLALMAYLTLGVRVTVPISIPFIVRGGQWGAVGWGVRDAVLLSPKLCGAPLPSTTFFGGTRTQSLTPLTPYPPHHSSCPFGSAPPACGVPSLLSSSSLT